MIDKEELILMTKLAIYDKTKAENDKKITSYFRNDYLLKCNMETRLCVLIGLLIVTVLFQIHRLLNGDIDILNMDYNAELWNVGIYFFIILLFYTVISTIIAAIRYNEAAKRRARYVSLTAQIRRHTKEDDGEEYGTDIVYKRSGR